VEPIFDFRNPVRPQQFDSYMLNFGKHFFTPEQKTDSDFVVNIERKYFNYCTFSPYLVYEDYLISNLDRIRDDLQYDSIMVWQILRTCLFNLENETLPPTLFDWLSDSLQDID
jgi:hypothetical protein